MLAGLLPMHGREGRAQGQPPRRIISHCAANSLGRELHKQDAQSSARSDGCWASLISSNTYIITQRSYAGADCMTQTL